MCFSATASFGASAVLSVIGVLTARQVRYKSQVFSALIPFFFAIQQAAEGVVWLSFTHPAMESWRLIAAYVFLLFAFAVWPVWIPLSVWYLEREHASRMLPVLTMIGAGVSLYLLGGLYYYDTVVTVLHCHISYDFPIATFNVYLSSLAYASATIAPFFCARTRYLPFCGVLGVVSHVASNLFYHYAFISVWCFFAAVLSVGIFFVIREQNRFLANL